MNNPETGSKVCLITATVRPKRGLVRLDDADARLKQYIQAISKLNVDLFDVIYIVENSNFDFSDAVFEILGRGRTKYLTYDEMEFGPIGRLEAKMYLKFMENFDGDISKNTVTKITGRYNIRNISEFFSGQRNIAFSFFPINENESLKSCLTSVYKMDGGEFEKWAIFSNETKVVFEKPLEYVLADYISNKNIKLVRKNYPAIDGISGSKAIAYSFLWKENLRKVYSRFFPLCITWGD